MRRVGTAAPRAEPAGVPPEEKPQLDLADLLDFAYCPLRVWWRQAGAELGEGGAGRARRSGEALVQQSIQQALRVYTKYHTARGLLLPEALGLVWKALLARWGLAELAPQLVEYSRRRADLLARFGPGGSQRRADGTAYQRPTWSRAWAKLAETSGLAALERAIDARQGQAGLAALPWREEDPAYRPPGLAETFARAEAIARALRLPEEGRILGAGVPMLVDLVTCQLRLTADLVVALGEETPRGRPAAQAEPRRRAAIAVELHVYEEELPPPASLARDLRVLALAQAELLEGEAGGPPARVARVTVRHMPSGAVEQFHPQPGTGLDVLEALATAVRHGIQAGAFVPRMVCGWRACGACDYRPACFSEPGVLQAWNPVRMAQIADGQALYQALDGLCRRPAGDTRAALAALLSFLDAHPGVGPGAALRVLETVVEGG